MLSPISERETIQDLERLVWIHLQAKGRIPNKLTTVLEIEPRWALSVFGERIQVRRDPYLWMLKFEKGKKPQKLERYDYRSCVQLLDALKALHPLEVLADI